MRLYPPVPSMSRQARSFDRIAGTTVPAGTMVVISPWIVHRHRLLWPSPDLFDPGRFMPGRREAIQRYAYLPFGAGPRICIGAGFAMQEAVIVLATLLREVELDLLPGYEVKPQQRVTLRPKGGLPMTLRLR
jgi:cytochrome P450